MRKETCCMITATIWREQKSIRFSKPVHVPEHLYAYIQRFLDQSLALLAASEL